MKRLFLNPVFLLTVVLQLAIHNSGQAQGPAKGGMKAGINGKFICISDIHFNPFFDPALVPKLVKTDYTGWSAILSQTKGYGSFTRTAPGAGRLAGRDH